MLFEDRRNDFLRYYLKSFPHYLRKRRIELHFFRGRIKKSDPALDNRPRVRKSHKKRKCLDIVPISSRTPPNLREFSSVCLVYTTGNIPKRIEKSGRQFTVCWKQAIVNVNKNCFDFFSHLAFPPISENK